MSIHTTCWSMNTNTFMMNTINMNMTSQSNRESSTRIDMLMNRKPSPIRTIRMRTTSTITDRYGAAATYVEIAVRATHFLNVQRNLTAIKSLCGTMLVS